MAETDEKKGAPIPPSQRTKPQPINMLEQGVTREPPVDTDAEAPEGQDMGSIGARGTRRAGGARRMPLAKEGALSDDADLSPEEISDDEIERQILAEWGEHAVRERVPFGAGQSRLPKARPRPGFHRHIFNDFPGRIESAVRAGYKHVNDEHGSPIRSVVGTSPHGGPLYGYLMEIPEKWFRQDMAAAQSSLDELDQEILGGRIAEKEGEGRYDAGIKIKRD